jgi:hypothetical protein
MGQVGTGCQIFDRFLDFVKNNRLLRAHKVISRKGCTSGVDEFIAPDNLAEIRNYFESD